MAKTQGNTITVEQIGSPIRRPAEQRATLIGLGLNKMHRRRTLEDTPSVRGMIASGKFTELRILPFSRKSRSVSAIITAQFSSASTVEAPRCGSATTLG